MKPSDTKFLENEEKTWEAFSVSLYELQEHVHAAGKLCIYGAGRFARILYDFLRMKQWRIDVLVVSDHEPIAKQYMGCIPIVHLGENPFHPSECKVILALDEKHIPSVQHNLYKTGYTKTIAPGNDFFSLLYIYNYFSVRLRNMCFNETNVKEKAKHFSEKYKRIVFHEILVSRFGPMLMFLIQKKMRDLKERDVLNVHIPMAIDYQNDTKFLLDDAWSANEYFYGYLKEQFLFANKHNVALWKTIIEDYPEKVVFSRQYSLEGLASYQQKQQNQISTKKYMSFHAAEFTEKKIELENMGINEKYVCFTAREDNYFHSIPGYNLNESQSRVRNCSVEKFAGMSKYLKCKGYQSVRMGTLVNAPVDIPDVIDYAVKYRTESMDFFLISQSNFVICQFSGFHLMAVLFNKPTILTDSIQLTVQGDSVDFCNPQQDIMLLKKIWSPYTKRMMSLREILLLEEKIPNLFQRTNYYVEQGYRFIENTTDEITGAVEEMVERLEGCIKYDEEYYSMQTRVKEIRDASVRKSGNMYFDIPLGWHFLKTNRWLLE